MRRVDRHVFSILATLSLVLCVAATALWIQSYWIFDQAHFVTAPSKSGSTKMRQLALDLDSGIASLSAEWASDDEFGHMSTIDKYNTNAPQEDEPGFTVHSYLPGYTPHYYRYENWRSYPQMDGKWFGYFQQDCTKNSTTPTGRTMLASSASRQFHGVSFPIWPAAAIFSVLPLAWANRWRQKRAASRRAQLGRCTKCGYDLRTSPDRCPECGIANPATITQPSV